MDMATQYVVVVYTQEAAKKSKYLQKLNKKAALLLSLYPFASRKT